MRHWWERMWLVPGTALDLAAARVVIAAHALWVLLSHWPASMASLPAEFYATVSLSAKLRYLLFPPEPVLGNAMQWLAIAALACAIIGVAPRIACFVAGIALYHVAPLETFFWTPNPYERGFTITVLAMITLAVTPSGDALTLWPRRAAGRDALDYGWPLRLVQFYLASVYLVAGIAKLRRVGLHWIVPENQRRWLLVFSQEEQVANFTALATWIASHQVLLWSMGIMAIVVDLGFVIAVFSRRSRWLVLPVTVAGHIGILFALNIFFINLPQLLVFVPWTGLRERFRGARREVETREAAAPA